MIDEEDRAERDEGAAAVVLEEADRVQRVDRGEHVRVARDRGRPEPRRSRQTTRIMIGPNTAPTPAVPRRWTQKRPTRITTVIGTTIRLERVRRDAQPFDRAQHRDRRRDHPVAVEQRRAEQADRHQDHARYWPAPTDEGDERENPAFPAVVRAHHEQQVACTDTVITSDQKISDSDAEDVGGRDRYGVCAGESTRGAHRAGWCRCRRKTTPSAATTRNGRRERRSIASGRCKRV